MNKIQELKQLLLLGLPAIIAQLSQMSLGVIDTMMAGRIDANALAAIAIGSNIVNPVVIFILGIFLALNPIVAHLNGRGDHQDIGAVFQHALVLALLLTLPCILILRNTEPLLILLGIQESIIPIVDGYLKACSYGVGAFLLFMALRFCNEGLFSNKAIMMVSLSAIPFNIIFNIWFIWGGFGLPAFGPVGVGYATCVVWLVMFLGMLGYTLFAPRYKHLNIFSQRYPFSWQRIWEIVRLGAPMGLGTGLEIAMFSVVGLMIGSYSVTMIAAHQVAINIAGMAFMIPLGLSLAISARVGFYAGRQKPEAAKLSGQIGIATAIAISVCLASTMLLLPSVLTGLYSPDPIVVAAAANLLFFAAIFQFSDALQVATAGALRGLKDTTVPMIISLIAYWCVGFPLGYYIAELAGRGVPGYWVGIIAGLSTAAVLLLVRWRLLVRAFEAKVESTAG